MTDIIGYQLKIGQIASLQVIKDYLQDRPALNLVALYVHKTIGNGNLITERLLVGVFYKIQ